MRTTVFRTAIPVALATFLLLVFWLILPHSAPVSAHPFSASEPVITATRQLAEPRQPDARWLALIREQANSQQANMGIFDLSLNLNLANGYAGGLAPLPQTIMISVTRDAALYASASVTPIPSGGGYFYSAWLGPTEWYSWYPEAGDMLWVKQGANTISMTVPTLTAFAETKTDTVYGGAPENAALTIFVYPFDDAGNVYTSTAMAGGDGAYTGSFADLHPRDSGYVLYTQGANSRAFIPYVAPFLRAQVNGYSVSGMAKPYSSVFITVTNSSGEFMDWLDASTGTDGFFEVRDYNEGDPLLLLESGYQLLASAAGQTFSMTVQNVSVHADKTDSLVWGDTAPNAPVKISRFAGPLQFYTEPWSEIPEAQLGITTTATGTFSVSMNLEHADYGMAAVASPDEYETFALFALPYVHLRLGNLARVHLLEGQVNAPNSQIEVSIVGPSGYLKAIYEIDAANNGYFIDMENYGSYQQVVLDTGDVVTLAVSGEVQIALTLPELTSEFDLETSTVFGLAPPNTRLLVKINNLDPGDDSNYYDAIDTSLVVTATAQGQYTADFSGLGHFRHYTSGAVELTTEGGHTIERAFKMAEMCPPIPTRITVGGNTIDEGHIHDTCIDIIVQLQDSQGNLKAEEELFDYDYLYISFYNDEGTPIPLSPGDTLDISGGGEQIAIEIPQLTASLAPQTDQITGQAPPGIDINISYYGELGDYASLTTTVSAQGTYTVSLPGSQTTYPGDSVYVWYQAEYTRMGTYAILPTLQAWLYRTSIAGELPSLSPYTLTLSSSPQIYTGYANDYGSFSVSTRSGSSQEIRLQPEDEITLHTPEQVLQMTIPFLSATLDEPTTTVSGEAPPNTMIRITLYEIFGTESVKFVTSSPSGSYSVSFPEIDPAHIEGGTVTHFSESGYQTSLTIVVPHWDVTIGDQCVSGSSPSLGANITLTLQTSSLRYTEVISSYVSSNGSFSGCFTMPVGANDHLSLESPTGVSSFTVPNLTAEYDIERKVLEGFAPANMVLEVTLESFFDSITRNTMTTPVGNYGLDVSDLDLLLGSQGHIRFTDEDGNITHLYFTIVGYPAYLPLITSAGFSP